MLRFARLSLICLALGAGGLGSPNGTLHAEDQAPKAEAETAAKPDTPPDLGSPKRIDLKLQDGTVGEALQALEKKFGWPVTCLGEAGDAKISVELTNATFFEALEAVRGAAKLGYTYEPHNRDPNNKSPFPIKLGQPNEGGSSPAAANGGVLVFVQQTMANVTKSVNAGTSERTHDRNYSLQAIILLEPGVRPTRFDTAEAFALLPDGTSIPLTNGSDRSHFHHNSRAAGQALHYNFHSGNIETDKELPSAIGIKLNLEFEIARGFSEQVIKEFGTELKLENGSLTVRPPGKADHHTPVEVVAVGKSAISLLQGAMESNRHMRRRMVVLNVGGNKKAQKGEDDDKEPGLIFLDAKGNEIGNRGYRSHSSDDSLITTFHLNDKPAQAVLRAADNPFTVKKDVTISGITLPE